MIGGLFVMKGSEKGTLVAYT